MSKKQEIVHAGQAQYKCRRCGEIVNGHFISEVPDKPGKYYINQEALDFHMCVRNKNYPLEFHKEIAEIRDREFAQDGWWPYTLAILGTHNCEDGGTGITDLIGLAPANEFIKCKGRGDYYEKVDGTEEEHE